MAELERKQRQLADLEAAVPRAQAKDRAELQRQLVAARKGAEVALKTTRGVLASLDDDARKKRKKK